MFPHRATGSGCSRVGLALPPSWNGLGPGLRDLPLVDYRFGLSAVPKGPHRQERMDRAAGKPGPAPEGIMGNASYVPPSTCPALLNVPRASFCLTAEEIEAQRGLAAHGGSRSMEGLGWVKIRGQRPALNQAHSPRSPGAQPARMAPASMSPMPASWKSLKHQDLGAPLPCCSHLPGLPSASAQCPGLALLLLPTGHHSSQNAPVHLWSFLNTGPTSRGPTCQLILQAVAADLPTPG